MQKLVEVALKKTILVDTLAVHFAFETICWFIKKVRLWTIKIPHILKFQTYILPTNSPHRFYHSAVFPIIYGILESDNREYVPYGLQLACALVEQYGHEVELGNDRIPTDEYEKFYNNLLNSDIWQSGVNVPTFVMVLRAYVRRIPRIALSGQNSVAVSQLTQKFISSKLNDQHGFLLASQLIRYFDVSFILYYLTWSIS